MRADEYDVVRVPCLGLGDDVEAALTVSRGVFGVDVQNSRDTVLGDGIDIEVANDLTRIEKSKDSLASSEGNGCSGWVGAFSAVGGAERTAQRTIDVVVDDGTSSTRGTGVGGLQTEVTRAARNERNGSRNLGGVVGLAASVSAISRPK